MQMLKKSLACFCTLILMGAAAGAHAADRVPKVDNFILLYDGSGSMTNDYEATGKDKAPQAKADMQTMAKGIPDLGYTAGLCTVAPAFAVNASMTEFPDPAYNKAIAGLAVPATEFGVQTPLASGISSLESLLGGLSGETAAILFSDGGENRGGTPARAATRLSQQYNVCFHVVSYAQSAGDRQTLKAIVENQDCAATMISAAAFQDETDRSRFIQKIFYTTSRDSDGDGVGDMDDECPNTPAGAAVDAVGCPLDSDGDGVFDYKDECPGTPAGVDVDAAGCALDSDGDGVADYKDECPDTRPELVVDDKGCPVKARMDLNVEFETNKAEIKPKHTDELDRAGEFLRNHPNARMRIEGHTDSIGAADYNQQLSEQRAAAVKTYLVEEFNIDPDRLKAKGFGESRPIATNDTAAGRQENRRVIGVVSKALKRE